MRESVLLMRFANPCDRFSVYGAIFLDPDLPASHQLVKVVRIDLIHHSYIFLIKNINTVADIRLIFLQTLSKLVYWIVEY